MEEELKGLQKFDLTGVSRCYTEYEITLTALPWGLLKDFCSSNHCDVMFRMTPSFITAYLIVYLKEWRVLLWKSFSFQMYVTLF